MRAALLAVCLAALALPGSASALEPNDPGWYMQWAERKMGLPRVWDYTTGSPNVVIAAVDTGVAASREKHLTDFTGAITDGWDFTDGDAVIDDEHGHGTLAAGIMVARGNNGWGIAGLCWKCLLMPVRVSRNGFASDELVAQGVRYAVDRGVRIISIGMVREDGGVPDPVLASAVAYAVSKGVLVVTPAGNNGNDAMTYPGAFPGVVATAGTDENDKLFSWSSRGPWVPLAAPGCHALVAIDASWGWHCGTSFTGPEVAGIAALALSLKPELSADAIVSALRSTAVPVEGVASGRIDALAALERLGAIPTAQPPPSTLTKTVTAVRTGPVRRGTRLALAVGTGRLKLTFTVKPAERCSLSVATGAELLLGYRRGPATVALDERVTAGRYVLEVACRSSRLKRYRLTVSSARSTRPVQLAGR